MASVTIDRIDALRRHIADAVTQTAPRSTLPEQEQERILEQACGEACELLEDWLAGQPAETAAAAHGVPIREFLKDQQHFTEFLGPLFADALKRAAGHPPDDPHATAIVKEAHDEVARAVRAASATARRHPRMRDQQVFEVAIERVGKLRHEVCGLADQLGCDQQAADRQAPDAASRAADAAERGVWKRRAVKALKAVSGFLLSLTVSLAVSVAGPQQAGQNLSAWMRGVEVVMAHDLAVQAQPGVTIAPPHAGPHLR